MHRSLDMSRKESMFRSVLVILLPHHSLADDLEVVLPISSTTAERKFPLRRVSTRDGKVSIDAALRDEKSSRFGECFLLETSLVGAAGEAIVVRRLLRTRSCWAGGGRRLRERSRWRSGERGEAGEDGEDATVAKVIVRQARIF